MTQDNTLIEIPAHVIRGAMLCQAHHDVRKYLNGVAFNGDTGEVVATNGHMLYVAEIEAMKGAFTGVRSLSIPQKVAAQSKKVYFNTETNTLIIDESGVHLVCSLLEGEYPPYAVIVPHKEDKLSAQQFGLNPKYVNSALKALEIERGSGHLWLQHDTKMVIQPMKSSDNPHRAPAKVIIMRLNEAEGVTNET